MGERHDRLQNRTLYIPVVHLKPGPELTCFLPRPPRPPRHHHRPPLQHDYRKEYCQWEVLELIRKLILSSCLMLMPQGDPWQVAIAAIISILTHAAAPRASTAAHRAWPHHVQL